MKERDVKLGTREVRAGYTNVAYVPAYAIHDLQQIREEYDSDKLQELADRIDLTPEGLDLVHPVTVAVFDDESILEQFLIYHARFYQYDYDPGKLQVACTLQSNPTFDEARHS